MHFLCFHNVLTVAHHMSDIADNKCISCSVEHCHCIGPFDTFRLHFVCIVSAAGMWVHACWQQQRDRDVVALSTMYVSNHMCLCRYVMRCRSSWRCVSLCTTGPRRGGALNCLRSFAVVFLRQFCLDLHTVCRCAVTRTVDCSHTYSSKVDRPELSGFTLNFKLMLVLTSFGCWALFDDCRHDKLECLPCWNYNLKLRCTAYHERKGLKARICRAIFQRRTCFHWYFMQ